MYAGLIASSSINRLRKQGNSPEADEAKDAYTAAKHAARHEVWLAKSKFEAEALQKLDPQGNDIYRLARQMDRTNQDIVGEKCVRNDADELELTDALCAQNVKIRKKPISQLNEEIERWLRAHLKALTIAHQLI